MRRFELVVPLLLTALLLIAPILSGDDPQRQHRNELLSEPSANHLFGTDEYGRDQLARFLHGGRWSVGVGGAAVALCLGLAWTLGACAALLTRFGTLVLWIADLFLCLPWLYLLIAARAAMPLDLPPRMAFSMLLFLLAFTGWARPARLVRGKVLEIRQRGYVDAALGFGHSMPVVFLRHILPSTWDLLLAQSILLLPRFVLAELTLSFLGAGASEPLASWGALIIPLKQVYLLEQHWWQMLPLLAMIPFFAAFAICGRALEARHRILR
jgi:peptide/nickel transport system permease protein